MCFEAYKTSIDFEVTLTEATDLPSPHVRIDTSKPLEWTAKVGNLTKTFTSNSLTTQFSLTDLVAKVGTEWTPGEYELKVYLTKFHTITDSSEAGQDEKGRNTVTLSVNESNSQSATIHLIIAKVTSQLEDPGVWVNGKYQFKINLTPAAAVGMVELSLDGDSVVFPGEAETVTVNNAEFDVNIEGVGDSGSVDLIYRIKSEDVNP